MESSVSLFTLRGCVTRSSKERSVLMANARTDILTNVETTKQTMDVLGEVNVSSYMLLLRRLMLESMIKWKDKNSVDYELELGN